VVPEPEQPVNPTEPTTPTDPEKPTDNGDGNGNVVTDNEGTTDTTTTDTNKETTKEDSKEKETTKDSKEDKKLPDTGSKVMNSAILTSGGLVLVLGVLIMFKKRFKKSK
ncbi:LPXTG cell wall anchor domain-containing protein, partial [Enterococcus faecalis]